MTDYYLLWAAGYACYVLGMMHAKGHTHWKNCAAALAIGLFWPVLLCYGIYATHFKTPNGEVRGATPTGGASSAEGATSTAVLGVKEK